MNPPATKRLDPTEPGGDGQDGAAAAEAPLDPIDGGVLLLVGWEGPSHEALWRPELEAAGLQARLHQVDTPAAVPDALAAMPVRVVAFGPDCGAADVTDLVSSATGLAVASPMGSSFRV